MFYFSRGVGDLKWKSTDSSVDHKEVSDGKFNLLSATLDRVVGFDDFSYNIDDTFIGDTSHVGDHLFSNSLRLKSHSLKCVEVLSESNKAILIASLGVVNSRSNKHLLSLESFVDLAQREPLSVGLVGGLDEGIVSEGVSKVVGNPDLFWGLHSTTIISC